MSLAQHQPVVPPVPSDKDLQDFSSLIQRSMQTLFGAAHIHGGTNGAVTAAPAPTEGNPGDILIGVLSTGVYLFVKINRTTWFSFGPGSAV